MNFKSEILNLKSDHPSFLSAACHGCPTRVWQARPSMPCTNKSSEAATQSHQLSVISLNGKDKPQGNRFGDYRQLDLGDLPDYDFRFGVVVNFPTLYVLRL